jgi:hypothetical protein
LEKLASLESGRNYASLSAPRWSPRFGAGVDGLREIAVHTARNAYCDAISIRASRGGRERERTRNRSAQGADTVENSFHVCGKIVEKMLHYVASFISYSQLRWSLAQTVDHVTE